MRERTFAVAQSFARPHNAQSMAPHKKLIEFRNGKGLSQSNLARQLKVTPSTLHRIEAGTQVPQIKVAARIAKLTSGSPSVEDWAIASETQGDA